MSNIIEKINSEDFEQKKAVEINGDVYDLPERTAELYEKLVDLEKKAAHMTEYDFLAENINIIFGRESAKQILKNGKKTNLDYLAKVYKVCVNLICEEKNAAKEDEFSRQLDKVAPLLDKLDKASPLFKKIN